MEGKQGAEGGRAKKLRTKTDLDVNIQPSGKIPFTVAEEENTRNEFLIAAGGGGGDAQCTFAVVAGRAL